MVWLGLMPSSYHLGHGHENTLHTTTIDTRFTMYSKENKKSFTGTPGNGSGTFRLATSTACPAAPSASASAPISSSSPSGISSEMVVSLVGCVQVPTSAPAPLVHPLRSPGAAPGRSCLVLLRPCLPAWQAQEALTSGHMLTHPSSKSALLTASYRPNTDVRQLAFAVPRCLDGADLCNINDATVCLSTLY
jgi:hypothetical protein